MDNTVIGLEATSLTPFAYHSLMVQGGSSTLPGIISDTAIMFALASTLGMMQNRVCLPKKDYRRDLNAMPWRASVMTSDNTELLPPMARRLNLEEEGGYKERHYNTTSKGNFKTYFFTQEVPPGVVFEGALFGFDPFEWSGQDELVLRIGLHRNGMIRLRKRHVEQVHLNAATASLFGRELEVERYLLYSLQLTQSFSLKDAQSELMAWQ